MMIEKVYMKSGVIKVHDKEENFLQNAHIWYDKEDKAVSVVPYLGFGEKKHIFDEMFDNFSIMSVSAHKMLADNVQEAISA